MYAKATAFIKDRKLLTEDSLEGLTEIVMDSEKAQNILKASRSSMGKFFRCSFYVYWSYIIITYLYVINSV